MEMADAFEKRVFLVLCSICEELAIFLVAKAGDPLAGHVLCWLPLIHKPAIPLVIQLNVQVLCAANLNRSHLVKPYARLTPMLGRDVS